MRTYAIIAGFITAIIVILLLITITPPLDDFSPHNPYWNGFSKISSEFEMQYLDSIIDERLISDPSKYVLLFIGPDKEFERIEINFVRSFIEGGGIVVLMDDFGTGNSLLELLEVPPRLNGSLLLDPLFKERAATFAKIRIPSMNISDVVMNFATVVDDCQRPIGYSSFYSFLDINMNGAWDEGEPKGPLITACEVVIGKGRLLIISDSSLGINSMIFRGSNFEFFKAIIGDRKCFIDKSHWEPSHFTVVKEGLSSFFSRFEFRYAVIIGVVLMLMKLKLERFIKSEESEVDKVLIRNPTWNKATLEKLWREMHGER